MAASKSDMLADLLGKANGDRLGVNESKDLRNRMYTLLKKSVDEIRNCGKYVFWRIKDRLKGYSSRYQRKIRGKSVAQTSPEETNVS